MKNIFIINSGSAVFFGNIGAYENIRDNIVKSYPDSSILRTLKEGDIKNFIDRAIKENSDLESLVLLSGSEGALEAINNFPQNANLILIPTGKKNIAAHFLNLETNYKKALKNLSHNIIKYTPASVNGFKFISKITASLSIDSQVFVDKNIKLANLQDIEIVNAENHLKIISYKDGRKVLNVKGTHVFLDKPLDLEIDGVKMSFNRVNISI